MSENNKPCAVKLLVTIVDRAKVNKVTDILREERIRFHFICLAEGTAGSEIMALLGLNSVDKAVVFCLEPECKLPSLLSLISERLQLRKPGKGIAFITPVTGLNNSVLQMIAKGLALEGKEDEKLDNNTRPASKYDLILAVVNQGHVDDVMDAARAAGARGGTVMHGRKIGVDDDAGKFFGISVQLEKDIVAILTTAEQRHDIMNSIIQACGMSKGPKGMIFSVPVDDIEGLGSVKPTEQ